MLPIERRVMRISQDRAAGTASDVSALPLASHAGAEKIKQLKTIPEISFVVFHFFFKRKMRITH